MVTVCGQVQGVQRNSPPSFTLLAHQWVHQLGGYGALTVQVNFPDTPRWQNNRKPLPSSDHPDATVVGYLTHIERSNNTMLAEKFHLELEHVVYYRGRVNLPVYNATATTPAPKQRAGRKLRFEDVFEDMPQTSDKRPRYQDSTSETDIKETGHLGESPMA
ncbi:hypothetical protein C8Q73DRAFT_713138 [Cubamyces lactineus]|nr:hypothetical protein C8Q73DRAFT_713138 [Cubamyces lactineus]